MPTPSDLYQRNLAALRRRAPGVAERLDAATPVDLDWSDSRAGPLTATVQHAGRPLALASRYDPIKEADQLVGQIDPAAHPCVAVMGVGLGYHLQRLVTLMGPTGLLLVFEPDPGTLRSVFEQIDCTAWLNRELTLVFDGEDDRARVLSIAERHSGILTQGTHLVTHPPTRRRHEEPVKTFSQALTEVIAFCRTNVATTLVNSARTCSNLVNNLPHYVAGSTVDDLYGSAAGYPAICVAAGPSLVRNVHLLRDPEVRRNVVVIAVQTALRPLLDRNIRPDFVTALDYAEISRRFYEDLPDLPDVTLVAEAKAHPSILDAFPGPVRVLHNDFNQQLVGELAPDIRKMPAGSTVAHLSFYLAQYLGCDPIAFIGQDLGFSDGLYYCPGTAVHRVWAPELNPFNTVEMMEWTRIVRMRGHLRRTRDIHDRPMFTDEQMGTYLKQFERDFAQAPQTIIDATEGGCPKQGATAATLADTLAQHATRPVPDLPHAPVGHDPQRLAQLRDRLRLRLDELRDLRQTTADTIPVLRSMQKHQRDPKRMAKLFKQLNRNQRHVEQDLTVIHAIVSSMNTVAMFKRNRADRSIAHHATDDYDRQHRQLERDIENLDWMIQAADETRKMLAQSLTRTEAALRDLAPAKPKPDAPPAMTVAA